MTSAIPADRHPSFQSTQAPNLRPAIKIDLDNLEEYAGIKPDDIGIRDWTRNKEMTPWKASEMLANPVPYFGYEYLRTDNKNTPPVQFTFKEAVKFVVDIINEYATHQENNFKDWQRSPLTELKQQLICDLGNIDTTSPELIGPDICSAQKFWLGTIISMLRDRGHIEDFYFLGANQGVYLKGKELINLVRL